MKTGILSFIMIFVLALNVVNAQVTFGDGLNKAKSSNKKILVNIYSEGDSWSQKMDNVYSSAGIKDYINSNFIYVKLNAGGSEKINYNGKEYTSAALAKFFGATGYPSHVFLNPDGSVIKYKYHGENLDVFPGFIDAPDFEKLLKYFAENTYLNTDLEKVL